MAAGPHHRGVNKGNCPAARLTDHSPRSESVPLPPCGPGSITSPIPPAGDRHAAEWVNLAGFTFDRLARGIGAVLDALV